MKTRTQRELPGTLGFGGPLEEVIAALRAAAEGLEKPEVEIEHGYGGEGSWIVVEGGTGHD